MVQNAHVKYFTCLQAKYQILHYYRVTALETDWYYRIFTMDRAFIEKYRQKLTENSIQAPNNECLLWTGCTVKTRGLAYGAINCKLAGKWTTMRVHSVGGVRVRAWCTLPVRPANQQACPTNLLYQAAHTPSLPV